MDIEVVEAFKIALNCIQAIDPFDGNNSSQLPDFLSQIDILLPGIERFDNTHKDILFLYIKSKCVGKARDAIHNSGNVTTWAQIKEILKSNFGEKMSVGELMDTLKTLTLNGTIENFYKKINKLMTRINNRRLTHDEGIFTTEEIKRICLEVFKTNLPDITKCIIYSRNPSTIEEAFKIILEVRHQSHTQYGNNNIRTNNFRETRNPPNLHRNEDRNNYRNSNRSNHNNSSSSNHNNRSNHNNSNNSRYNNQNNNSYNYNNNHNNNSNHDQHRTLSQNTRRSNSSNYNQNNQNYNNNRNRYNNNSTNDTSNQIIQAPTAQGGYINNGEPMEIGQVKTDFQPRTSENFLI